MSGSVTADSQTGLSAKVYRYPINVSAPTRSDSAYTLCSGAWTSTNGVSHDFGSGSVGGCVSDYVMIHLQGFVEFKQDGPSVERQLDLAARFDDGVWFTMDGTDVFSKWTYTGTPSFASFGKVTTNTKYPLDVWYYDGVGSAKLDVTMSVDGGYYVAFEEGASCGAGCTVSFTGPTPPTTTTTTTTSTTTSTTTTSTTTTIVPSTTTIPVPSPTTTVTMPANTSTTTSTSAASSVVNQSDATTTISSTTTLSPTTTSTTIPSPGKAEHMLDSLMTNPLSGAKAVRFIELTHALVIGEPAAGRSARARATGLAPASPVSLTLHSDPVVLGTTTAGASGEAIIDATLPPGITPGLHMLVLTGTRDNGEPISSTIGFTVADDGSVAGVSPPSESASHSLPSASDMGRALESGLSLFDPNANAASVAALGAAVAVAAAAAASVLAGGAGSGGGASRGADGGSRGDSSSGRSESHADLAGVDLGDIGTVGTDRAGRGDRSWLWRAPGGDQWGGLLARACTWAQTRSTLLTRSLSDGQAVRAMFGSVDAVVCASAVVLGLAAASSVHWLAIAPATGWVAAIVALSMLNALAGLVAAVMFTVPIALAGNAFTVYDARTLLGLTILFVAPALLANAIRPLRRDPGEAWWWFDRAADYLIVPLFLGFSMSSVYSALNGLSGLEMVDGSEAEVLKFSVMACAVARLLVEDVATRQFPGRLARVHVTLNAGPGMTNRLVVLAMRGFIYLSVAAPFFGLGWQTWTMLALTLVVPLLSIVLPNPPNSAVLHRFFPRGILRTVIMMFVASWLAARLFGDGSDPERIRAMTVWMLLPGVALGLIDLLAREGGSWPESFWKRLAGGGLWAYSALVLLGFASI